MAHLDTARVERLVSGAARLWFRFAYATPMSVGADVTVKYAAWEAREELDCADCRIKDLEVRLETTTGVSTGTPVPNPDWNPTDTHPLNSGVFFDVGTAYLGRFPIRQVGTREHQEYWVPSEELPELNAHIVGLIEVVAEYRAAERPEEAIREGSRRLDV